MSKILKNNTASNVFLSDVGQTVPASSQLTISPSDYDKYAQSNNVITKISDLAVSSTVSTLTVNDGSVDLSISDGADLIKGIFSRRIIGATDGTAIGNVGDRLKVDNSTSYSALISGQLFSVSVEANAAAADVDNPIILLRNPLNSGKNVFVKRVISGVTVTNVSAVHKVFGSPTLTTTQVVISTIVQNASSTTVTVTTATPHGATVGATTTIAGTTNFNESHTVVSVTSTTVYTFTRAVTLVLLSENTGTSTMTTSLGTALSEYPMKRAVSPTAALALATSLPTVTSNGEALAMAAQGQNSTGMTILQSDEMSLEPGQNLLVTTKPASNNRAIAVTIIWMEIPQS